MFIYLRVFISIGDMMTWKELKPMKKVIRPVFRAKVRSGGNVEVITIPRDLMADYGIEKGDEIEFEMRTLWQTSIKEKPLNKTAKEARMTEKPLFSQRGAESHRNLRSESTYCSDSHIRVLSYGAHSDLQHPGTHRTD